MTVKPPRPYYSPHREEQANATRRRILQAAEQLLADQGFAATTMQGIAQHAGVSLATVYLYFPGKAALVKALAADVVASPDLSVELVEREADPVRQLEIGARIIRALNERSWVIAGILRAASPKDGGLGSIWARWQQRHLEAIRRAIEALARGGALRQGLALDEAIDAFYALAGADVYRALVHDRGWSPERYERWLFELACRELLGRSSTTEAGSQNLSAARPIRTLSTDDVPDPDLLDQQLDTDYEPPRW